MMAPHANLVRSGNVHPTWLLRLTLIALFAIEGVMLPTMVFAQGWRPQRSVELVVPASAGGSLDITARTVQQQMLDLKLVTAPIVVVNRAGAGHLIAYNYLKQRDGDPHYIGIATSVLITGHTEGRLPMNYTAFTPLALLLTEYIAFAVRTDSPLATGESLLEALKKNPDSLTIALGSGVGGTHHITAGLPMQSAGVDVSKVTFVGYKSSSDAVTSLLGGDVDVAVIGTVNAVPHFESGRIRILAVSSPKRMGGILSTVPTWPELGRRGVSGSWRSVIASKGLSPGQITYWEDVLAGVVQSESFRKSAEKNQWAVTFKRSEETRRFMDEQNVELKGVMSYLGLAK